MNGVGKAFPPSSVARVSTLSTTANAIVSLLGSPAALESLAHTLPLNILIVDRDLKVCWANAWVAQEFRETPASIVGRKWMELMPRVAERSALYERVFAGEEIDISQAGHALGQSMVYMDVRYRPVRNDSGAVVGMLVVSQDVTARFLAERTLRQVTEASADYLALLDLNLHVVFLNRALAWRPQGQVEGKHITELLPQHVHPGAIACMRRVIDTGYPDRCEGEIAVAAGEFRHIEFRISPVVEDDRIVGLTLNASDTTEYKLAERAIATQAKMIESMLEGVAVVNGAGLIEITNPAFDRLFGYGHGELITRRLAELSEPSTHTDHQWLSDIAQLVGDRESVPIEFEGRARDAGRLALAGVLSSFDVAGRNRYLVVLQDISERKALERAIIEASNREQYRIGNDLHDGLGQELTGISLMLKGVAGRLAKECPTVLPDIESITRLVSNAVESTRALARGLSPVNLERGGLIDALEGLAMHARDLYSAQVNFSHRLRETVPISAELGNHLYRIAQEAVTNAVRHGHARNIDIQLSSVRGKIRMIIIDDGSGMSADALDAPGMGLKIMQHRARISGGTVLFETSSSGGVRVICECPFEPPHVPLRRRSRRRAVASESPS